MADSLDVPEMYLIVESMIDGLLEATLDADERLQLEDVLGAVCKAELVTLAVHDSPKGEWEWYIKDMTRTD